MPTNVLSARPDPKKTTPTALPPAGPEPSAARGRQAGADAGVPGSAGDPPLTLIHGDFHLQLEGSPIEQGDEIEIPQQLPPSAGGPARDFG